jgi:hypothetical protein
MKTLFLISRVLLGLIFTVFGLNGLIAFFNVPPHPGVAGQLMGAMNELGFLVPVFALQFAAGGLLLANRFVPLALALLAPIIVNILLFHVLMDGLHGLGIPAVLVTLWAIVLYPERSAFAGLFSRLPQSRGTAGNPQPSR